MLGPPQSASVIKPIGASLKTPQASQHNEPQPGCNSLANKAHIEYQSYSQRPVSSSSDLYASSSDVLPPSSANINDSSSSPYTIPQHPGHAVHRDLRGTLIAPSSQLLGSPASYSAHMPASYHATPQPSKQLAPASSLQATSSKEDAHQAVPPTGVLLRESFVSEFRNNSELYDFSRAELEVLLGEILREPSFVKLVFFLIGYGLLMLTCCW
jgi:hypothetical protein